MVRVATQKDVKAINTIGRLLDANFAKLFKMSEILENKYSQVYVHVVEGKIIGFIHLVVLYETADIINIVVNPKYRRNGVASTMIDYAISNCCSGLEVITLEVTVDNEAAINLYQKFGFEKINIRVGYYHQKDAYLMGKVLK